MTVCTIFSVGCGGGAKLLPKMLSTSGVNAEMMAKVPLELEVFPTVAWGPGATIGPLMGFRGSPQ